MGLLWTLAWKRDAPWVMRKKFAAMGAVKDVVKALEARSDLRDCF